MRICLVCSSGGHLTELLQIVGAFEGHEVFWITYEFARGRDSIHGKKYLVENIGFNPFMMATQGTKIALAVLREKPDLVVSTGSEIAIPAFIAARICGAKTIFIESWCRIVTKSGTGRILYHFSDLFLVQWPSLLRTYGKRALFLGGVI